MFKTTITVADVCYTLNSATKLDKNCMKQLIEKRVVCNEALEKHKTIQVLADANGMCHLSVLGLINGVFGVNKEGCGPICYSEDENGNITFKPIPNFSQDAIDRLELRISRCKIDISRIEQSIQTANKIVKDRTIEAYHRSLDEANRKLRGLQRKLKKLVGE